MKSSAPVHRPGTKRKTASRMGYRATAGIRQRRRCPHSAPGERAPRSTSGACELVSLRYALRKPSENRMAPPEREKNAPQKRSARSGGATQI